MNSPLSIFPSRIWALLCVCIALSLGCPEEEDVRDTPQTDVECLEDAECGETEKTDWSDCETPDFCAEVGEQTREVTTYGCEDEACVTDVEVETRECTVDTDGIPCDDGFSCTSSAECGEGICQPGVVDSGKCFMDGACFDDQEHHPDDECLYCDAGSFDDRWSSVCPVEVYAGSLHSCALDTIGGIHCWGISDATFHDLGQVRHMPGGIYEGLDSGGRFNCVLDADGDIECWGDNTEGQEEVPVGNGPYEELTTGGYHGCALDADGQVQCWGDLSSGQSFPPDGVEFGQLAAGYEHTCGVDMEGEIHCWGDDTHGQSSPDVDADVSELTAGKDHSCILDTDGHIHCWGADGDGQVSDVPQGAFDQVDAGKSHSCAVDDEGSVFCWGQNEDGQLDVVDGSYQWVAAGGNFSCALDDDADVQCWGDNEHSQLEAPNPER